MNLKITFLLVSILITLSVKSQVISPQADAYNWSYDSLIVSGNTGISSGLLLGIKSPNMGLMYYNRAIEIQPENPLAYERKGEAYLNYKMLDEATEAYTQCLDLDGDNVNCIYGIFAVSAQGTTNYNLEEVPLPMMKQVYNSAVAFLKVAPPAMAEDAAYAELLGYLFKLGIDNPDAYKKYVPLAIAGKLNATSYSIAEELLPAVIATDNKPVLANLYDKLSQYYFIVDNVAKTKENCLNALATGYAYTTTYYYLGLTYYYNDKNTTEAIKVLEDGLKKKGPYENSSNLLLKIFYKEGKAAYLAKNYPLAIDYLGKLAKINPESERGNAFLGFSLYNNKNYADAAKALKAVKRVANPNNVNVYYPNLNALIAFAEKPSTTSAAPAVKTTLVELEKNEEIYKEGDKLLVDKNYEAAIAKYNEALVYFNATADNPSIEKCYNGIGLCYHNTENYEKAKEYYKKSIELGASDQSSYTNYAFLLYAVDKNYELAETIINDGLVKFPENVKLLERNSKMNISHGYSFYNAEDYAASIPYFQKGLEYQIDARAYIYLGYALNELKRIDEAVTAWDYAFYYDDALIAEFRDVYDFVQSKLKN